MVDLNRYARYVEWHEKNRDGQRAIFITIPRNRGHPDFESIHGDIKDEMSKSKEFRVGDRLFQATRFRTTLKSMTSIIEIVLGP